MSGLLLRIRSWWETADRTQKAVTVFGTLFLLLLLGGTFYFASKPHMALAFSNLDSAEVGTVTDEITKLGIPVEFDVQGNVQVPSDKVALVRAKLAEAGKLPTAGHMGADTLNISNFDTKEVTDVRILKAKEQEIAQAVQNIQGIQAATVSINPGDTSPFADASKPATASVEVTTAPNQIVDSSSGRVIAMLVANAGGLTPDKVFVADNSGHTLWDGGKEGTDSETGGTKIQTEIAETNRRERDLQQALDATFGRGNTLVKVNLELNYDKKTVREDLHPKSAALTTKSTSTETMNGSASGAPPVVGGMNANTSPTPSSAGSGSSSSKGYEGKTTQEEHPVDERITDTAVAVGGVKSMAITALVNSSPADGKPPINSAAVEQFIGGYLGPKAVDMTASSAAGQAPDKTATLTYDVVTTPFDTTTQKLATDAQAASQTRDRMQQILSFLPIAALIFVGFMVVKAISKAGRFHQVVALPGGGTLMLGQGERREEALDADGQPIEHHESQSIEEIGAIQEKLNLPLEQIKRMSDDKSENVAMLLKTWMMEDHR